MKRLCLGISLVLGSVSGLVAEENGVYLGASYQIGQARMYTNVYSEWKDGTLYPPGTGPHYNNFQGTNVSWHAKYGNGALNGFGIQVGQKLFFKPPNAKTKWAGLRYYGFFNFGHANLGPQRSDVGSSPEVRLNMTAWGVGIDALGNFIDRANASVGLFGGVAIGGNSWTSSTTDFWKQQLIKRANLNYTPKTSPVNFQVWLDFGLRTNLFKHNGVELGVKVPLLVNQFLHNQWWRYNLKRDYSVYVAYLYTF
ncbi:outer membrane protein [Helicobacter salomonis]|uniref:OMP181 n=1 Tax=Helicobacter salomonis TaxID=56878 RepID=A0A1M4NIP0_9HELI|nr:outer membrane protein [Helicobacter salomonis]SFZ72864.1 OMP181 [Helicobacter salomonis]SFZ72969.1 OMP275 [Helicobacter salomonis]